MKTELKGWLADNTVTTDNKEDKILVLESAGNLTLSDVLDEMKKEDTSFVREQPTYPSKDWNEQLLAELKREETVDETQAREQIGRAHV